MCIWFEKTLLFYFSVMYDLLKVGGNWNNLFQSLRSPGFLHSSSLQEGLQP